MLALWVTQTRRAWWWRRPRLRDWGLDEGSEWYELLQPKAVIGVEKAALRYREELGEILTAMQDKKSVQARFGQACVLRVEALRFQWHHLHDRPFLQNACRIERDLRLVDLWDEDVLLDELTALAFAEWDRLWLDEGPPSPRTDAERATWVSAADIHKRAGRGRPANATRGPTGPAAAYALWLRRNRKLSQRAAAEAAVRAFGWQTPDGTRGEPGAEEEDEAPRGSSSRRRNDEKRLIAPSREVAVRRVEREVQRQEQEKNRARQD